MSPLALQSKKLGLVHESSSIAAANNNMVAMARIVLALTALPVTYFDSSQLHNTSIIYLPIILYIFYSAVLYILSKHKRAQLLTENSQWIDIGWYLLFIVLNTNARSIFFFFFLFPILVASFRKGFNCGFGVSVISAVLLTIIGYWPIFKGTDFVSHEFLIRSICLLALGYVIAYLGELELTEKLRLAVLKDVARFSNPRLGIDLVINSVLKHLHTLYCAERCLLLIAKPGATDYSLYKTNPRNVEQKVRAEPIPLELANRLLSLPADWAVIYCSKPRILGPRSQYAAYKETKRECATKDQKLVETLATVLDVDSFLSVPVHYHNEVIGRLYVTARRGIFTRSDINFVLELIERVIAVIDNVMLVEKPSASAIVEERRKIALDLHDSAIQPYIGLQIGLAGIRNKIAAGDSNVIGDVEKLIGLANQDVADLRRYMQKIREDDRHRDDFLSVVQSFASRFSEATGISVKVIAEENFNLSGQIAVEAIQLVTEGLSNIRRHTESLNAIIELACREGELTLRIGNETSNGSSPTAFIPRSLSERAQSLGGYVRVEQNTGESTVVHITIPL